MNSTLFTAFLSIRSLLREVFISFDSSDGSISAETEDAAIEDSSNIQLAAKALYDKTLAQHRSADYLVEKPSGIITIPKRLMNAAVIGISEEGSMRSAKRLAWSMLLNVEKSFTASDSLSAIDLTDIDCIIISGGYNDSLNKKLENMIESLSKNPQLPQIRPEIIFAGSVMSLNNARSLLQPFTDKFSEYGNVLEDSSFSIPDKTLPTISSSHQSIPLSEQGDKIPSWNYTEALQKTSELFCTKRDDMTLSLLFTADYSLICTAARDALSTTFRNYAVPHEGSDLTQEHFSSVINELLLGKKTVFDENFLQKKVLPVEQETEKVFLKSRMIIGTSLNEKISFKEFIDIVTASGIIRGVTDFIFDEDGTMLAAMSIFLAKKREDRTFIRSFFDAKDIKNGSLIIPFGKFKKDSPALYIEVVEDDGKEDLILKWGKRFCIDVNPNSVVEIYAAKGVYLDEEGKTKETVRTKDSVKTLVFELKDGTK